MRRLEVGEGAVAAPGCNTHTRGAEFTGWRQSRPEGVGAPAAGRNPVPAGGSAQPEITSRAGRRRPADLRLFDFDAPRCREAARSVGPAA